MHPNDAAPLLAPLNADSVIARLEEAGRTLLSLPSTGPSTRLVQSGLEWIRDAAEAYSPGKTKLRPAVPGALAISRMDTTMAWLALIPNDRYVLRRIVGARSLVNPLTDRHLYTWRRLGTAIGSDHKAVQRWHAQGVDMIVAALRQRRVSAAPGSGAQRHPGVAQPPRHHGSPHA